MKLHQRLWSSTHCCGVACQRKNAAHGSLVLAKLFKLCTRARTQTISSLCSWSFTTKRKRNLVLRTVYQPSPSKIISLGGSENEQTHQLASLTKEIASRICILLPSLEAVTPHLLISVRRQNKEQDACTALSCNMFLTPFTQIWKAAAQSLVHI